MPDIVVYFLSIQQDKATREICRSNDLRLIQQIEVLLLHG